MSPTWDKSSQQEDGLQYIHAKLVGSQFGLRAVLTKNYGPGNYKVKLQHNVYRIEGPANAKAIDLDDSRVRNSLAGRGGRGIDTENCDS